ncbi:UBX domain-containing protein 4 [Synchiropus picturatus]
MHWFGGSIPDAINSAKQRGYIFVVVITGDDELSTQLRCSWEDDKVAEAAQSCCVAIKVDARSETCVQFSQIYPVVCIPSCFFIGENGIPLEVIAGTVTAEELIRRIKKVKELHDEQVGKTAVDQHHHAAPASAHVAPHGSAPAEFTASPSGTNISLPSMECANPSLGAAENDVGTSEGGDAGQGGAGTCVQTQEHMDAKVERLTKKLEERRERRKKEEEENEIEKEMERRKMGKDIQDFKRKQEEMKTKQLLEERLKEKAEERAARERVKQQIELDRADRAARFARNQEEKLAAKQAQLQARQAEEQARREMSVRERSVIARIQFRLPDGSSFTNKFQSTSKLLEARQFAAQEVGNRYGNFRLATMFPRREFTSEDLDKTLLELELAPSASIVLLPNSDTSINTVVQSSGGGIWTLLGSLFYPLLAVWRFLSSFLFVSQSRPGGPSNNPAQQSNSHTSSSAPNKPNRDQFSKHTQEKQSKDFKKDGKVCRLRTQEDTEDENNTWNGNSTQQM